MGVNMASVGETIANNRNLSINNDVNNYAYNVAYFVIGFAP